VLLRARFFRTISGTRAHRSSLSRPASVVAAACVGNAVWPFARNGSMSRAEAANPHGIARSRATGKLWLNGHLGTAYAGVGVAGGARPALALRVAAVLCPKASRRLGVTPGPNAAQGCGVVRWVAR
jgi:hypothetical protein